MHTRRPGTDQTYIYGLLCPVENKISYVGKSNDPAFRYKQHIRLWNAGRDSSKAVQLKENWIR